VDRIARLADVHYPVLVMPPGIAWVGRVREALGLPGPMSVEGYELMGKDWRFSSEKTERELGYAARPIAETLKATVDSNLELIEAEPLKGREPRRYPRSPRSRCPRRSRSRCFSRSTCAPTLERSPIPSTSTAR